MRIPPVALLILLSACTAGSDWPSLARRPGESAPLPNAAVSMPPVAAPGSSGISTVVAGRIVEAGREFAAVGKRWQGQQAVTAAAFAAARGAPDSSEVTVKAQLELSRFDRIGAQISDLRTRLDAIGGELALAAADGRDPGGALREIGGLIGKVEALRTEHLAATTLLRNK